MNSWNNFKSSYTDSSLWLLDCYQLKKLSNEIRQEQKQFNNDIDVKFYLDAVDNVIAEYMKEKMEDENEISDTAAENIKYFVKLLCDNYITDYKVIPSPIGAIYCEWNFDKASMGVGFLEDNIDFEYYSLKNNEKKFIQKNLKNQKDFYDALYIVKRILNAKR